VITRKFLWVLILSLLIAPNAFAVTRYVDLNATGGNNGISWTDAFTTIQAALDVANPGDEIWVAQGVYNEVRNSGGSNPFGSLNLVSQVDVYGGFEGDETARSQRDIDRFVTIIDGANGRAAGVAAYNVVLAADNALLDGFTIRNGAANGSANNREQRGGGVYINTVDFTLSNCIVSGNSAFIAGGGIYIEDVQYNDATGAGPFTTQNVVITDSIIENNTCRNPSLSGPLDHGIGGGISTLQADPTIQRCVIRNNLAQYGGGMLLQWTRPGPLVSDCLIYGNTARQRGGGVYLLSAEATLRNCTIMRNTAQQAQPNPGADPGTNYGGGAVNQNSTVLPWPSGVSVPSTTPAYINCLIRDNTDSSGLSSPEQIVNQPWTPINPTFSNCNIGPNSFAGQANSAPALVDPINGDYRYANGTTFGVNDGTDGVSSTDIRGFSRQGTPDIGAYEFGTTPVVADFDGDPKSPAFVIVGNNVEFDNLSQEFLFGTSSSAAYLWNFGDATTSTVEHPSKAYSAVGDYTVSLTTTTFRQGTTQEGTDSETKNLFITVADVPIVDFSVDFAQTYVGNDVMLTDLSNGNNLTISNYSWDFDDNGSPDSTVASPTASYGTTGFKDVRLTASNAAGSSNELKNDFVEVRAEVDLSDPPPSQTAFTATSAVFTVNASGGYPGYTFQWQFFNQGTSLWQDLGNGLLSAQTSSPYPTSGASVSNVTTATLTITDVDPEITGIRLRCVAEDSLFGTAPQPGGTHTSEESVLSVNNVLNILTDPAGGTFYVGDLLPLSVVAAGGSNDPNNYTYSWRRGAGSGTGVPGDPGTASWNFPITDVTDANSYKVVVTDPPPSGIGETVTSADALLLVEEPVTVTLDAETQRNTGDSFTLTGIIAGGYVPYTAFQWFYEGNPINDGDDGGEISITDNVLTRTNLDPADSGTYTLQVTDSVGTGSGSVGTSNDSELIVTDLLTVGPTTRVSSSTNLDTVYDGGDYTLTVAPAGGDGNYTYQWQVDTGTGFADLADGGAFAGVDTDTLVVTGAAVADAGDYRCVVGDGLSQINPLVFSAPLAIGVVENLSIVTPLDANSFGNVGEFITYDATATGGIGAINYEWQVDYGGGFVTVFTGNVSGETTAMLTIDPLALADSADYRCVVTDSGPGPQQAIAGPTALTVTDLLDARVPEEIYVYTGNPLSITSTPAGGVPAYSYSWRKNGVVIGAPDSNVLDLGNADAGDVDVYDVIITDNISDTATSNTVEVFVADAPSLASAGDVYGYLDTDVIIPAPLTGGFPPFSYTWRRETLDFGAGDVSSITVNESVSTFPAGTEYDIEVTDGGEGIVDGGTDTRVPTVVGPAAFNVFIDNFPIAFTAEPQSFDAYKDDAPFNISASFTGGLSLIDFEWRRRIGTGPWEIVNSGTFTKNAKGGLRTRTLIIDPSGQMSELYEYQLLVNDFVGETTSAVGEIEFADRVQITTPLVDQTVDNGDMVQYDVVADGGLAGTLMYSWTKDGNGIAGEVLSTLDLGNVDDGDAGTYEVQVSEGDSSFSSGASVVSSATLTVSAGVPAAGGIGLVLLSALTAGFGARVLRRRK